MKMFRDMHMGMKRLHTYIAAYARWIRAACIRVSVAFPSFIRFSFRQ